MTLYSLDHANRLIKLIGKPKEVHMDFVDSIFANAFFQLPMMEGMMYVAVVLLIGAAIFGLWDRLVGSSSRQAPSYQSYEWKKAA